MVELKLLFQILSTAFIVTAVIMEWLAYRSYKKVRMSSYEAEALQSVIFYFLALVTKMITTIIYVVDKEYWSGLLSVVTVIVIVLLITRQCRNYKRYKIHYQCKRIDDGLNRIVEYFKDSSLRPVDITSTCNYSDGDVNVRFIYTILDNNGKNNEFTLYMTQEVYKSQTEGLVDLTMRLYSKMKDAGLVDDLCIRKHEVIANEEV